MLTPAHKVFTVINYLKLLKKLKKIMLKELKESMTTKTYQRESVNKRKKSPERYLYKLYILYTNIDTCIIYILRHMNIWRMERKNTNANSVVEKLQ